MTRSKLAPTPTQRVEAAIARLGGNPTDEEIRVDLRRRLSVVETEAALRLARIGGYARHNDGTWRLP